MQIYGIAGRFATVWWPFSVHVPHFPGMRCARWCWRRDTGRDYPGKTLPVVSIQGHRARVAPVISSGGAAEVEKSALPQDEVEGVGVLAAVGVGAEEGVEVEVEEVAGAGGGAGP